MPMLEIGPKDGLYYEYDAPVEGGSCTFVFVNAITGSTDMWQGAIGPALRGEGFGTLAFNFRGQPNSPFDPALDLTETTIAGDLKRLVDVLEPPRPVLVGLSIGGLYAARAFLAGCAAAGIVLVNTLRRIGPRIAWMNDATARALAIGGPDLLRDIMTPLLCGPDFLAANRSDFLKPETRYEPLPAESGQMNLVRCMGKSDWDIPYEKLTCPVLVMTGPHDRVFYDADVVQELYHRLPNARRSDIAEAGHMLPVETAENFIEALKDFGAALT